MNTRGKVLRSAKRVTKAVRPGRSKLGLALAGTLAILLLAVAVASGQVGAGSSHSKSEHAERWISTTELVQRHEALPCTGPKDPINFEIFTAGPEIAGLAMREAVRRCDAAAPEDEAPANQITYLYGDCEIPTGATGCRPPLEVQTWPACQRRKGEFTYDGKPLPYKELPGHGGAEVVEYRFGPDGRIEVYARSSTIVIYADSRKLALEAVERLIPQEEGKPPAMSRAELRGEPAQRLGAPGDGATEGEQQC